MNASATTLEGKVALVTGAGRGIGRAIFHLCETAARSTGVPILECYSSLNAEGFYAALGFESVRMIQIDLGRNVVLPAILMRRTI